VVEGRNASIISYRAEQQRYQAASHHQPPQDLLGPPRACQVSRKPANMPTTGIEPGTRIMRQVLNPQLSARLLYFIALV